MDVIDISSSDGEDPASGLSSPHTLPAAADDDISVSDIFNSDEDADANGEVDQLLPNPIPQRRVLPHYMDPPSNPRAQHPAAPPPAVDHRWREQQLLVAPGQNPGKRVLPSSLQPPGSRERNRQFLNVPLKSRGGQELAVEDDYFDDSDPELYIYQDYDSRKLTTRSATGAGSSNGMAGTSTSVAGNQDFGMTAAHRVLPAWMDERNDFGKYGPGSQFAGMFDGRDHLPLAEQGGTDYDERMIYETVLQDLAQPKSELDLDGGLLAVSLLRHQKIALAWMEQKERTSRPCSGGILADDQGLGKTVSMIALILKQMPLQKKFTSSQMVDTKLETLNLDEDENIKLADAKQDKLNLDGNGSSKSYDKKPDILDLGNNDNAFSEVKKRDFSEGTKKVTVINSASNASKGRPAGGTLVVCPASILRQWARELDEKVASDAKLSVKIYHGSSRTKQPSDLAKYDVIITTYAIITNEVPKQSLVDDDDGDRRNPEDYGLTPDFSNNRKRKTYSYSDSKKKKKGKGADYNHGVGPLSKVRWFRIILDEAQVIKNHRTQIARACCGLRAKTRWCLSGTPLQNAVDDLYSYFRFLKYDPYAKYSSFCSALKHPLFRDAVTGYKKLQAVLRAVMLRRTKDTTLNGQPILKLPPKSVSLKKLCFTTEERSFYGSLEANFRDRFRAYAAEGTVKQNYANILIMLLRLRQACDHPLLVKDYSSDSSGKTSVEVAKKMPLERIKHLLSKLDASSAICAICHDSPEDAIVTHCGHVFCYQCVSENLTGEGSFCPAAGCRVTLDTNSLFSRGTLRCCVPNDLDIGMTPKMDFEGSTICGEGFVSTKIKATLKILISLQSKNSIRIASDMDEHSLFGSTPGIVAHGYSYGDSTNCSQSELPLKALVFSQWTSMLDLLESSLNQFLIPYRRLDGSMSLASRDKAVKDFNTDPEVTVMIMSLKAGNLGLNMVAACHVILLDLWWNPTSEDQAVDRAHRIGQTRPVSVHRLSIEDTVEERILELQEKKRQMVSSAFGEDTSDKKAATRLTMEDLRYLFQV